MRKTLLNLALGATALMGSAAPAFAPGQLDGASYWGTLNTPDGEEWMYTAQFEYEDYSISGAEITVYDTSMAEVNTINIDLQLGENETIINQVQLSPTLTKKFFNYDDSYEIMVFVHAATTDYRGHFYTNAYSLKDGSLICTLEGNHIGSVNTAQDQWSENYTLAFMREVYEPSYTYYVDVYSKATWGANEPTLQHTFVIDYERFAGAEGGANYFLMAARDGKDMYYAVPYYEKPFFVSNTSEEATPDNNFVIDLYDANFELVKTTKIPMSTKEGTVYSFPGMGLLSGWGDLDFDLFSDGQNPAYIVGVESYVVSKDEFITDYYVYDTDGNLVNTIVEDADDIIRLSDISGQERQYFFYRNIGDQDLFTMVNVPSCTVETEINAVLPSGDNITTTLDRVAVGSDYMYVSSFALADGDAQGNALHKIAWLNRMGELDHVTTINLGTNITYASPNLTAKALDPYLFNTDSDTEYMFLVKQLQTGETSKSSTYLRIYGEGSNLVFEAAPDLENGAIISSVFLQNVGTTNAKLVVVYNKNYEYIIKHYDLPITKFAGGDGTAENPYLISSTGDVMKIATEPSACYKVINDIDFEYLQFEGNDCNFTGTLDGDGHTISNLRLYGNGLFTEMSAGATVKNLTLSDCELWEGGSEAGFIANTAYGYSASTHPTVTNARIANSILNGSAEGGYYGGLIGTAYVYTTVSECALEDCWINCEGTAGGVVGQMRTSSRVESCAFYGGASATTAGGIVGETIGGDESINNCHAYVSIYASTFGGGIIGYSGRSAVTNCIAEGGISTTDWGLCGIGGIIGALKCTYDENPSVIVKDNIVANFHLGSYPIDCYKEDYMDSGVFMHRIVGRTASDENEYDYDDNGQPYVVGKKDPEKGLADNYAVNCIITEGMEDEEVEITESEADMPNGATLAEENLTEEFLQGLGFAFGNEVLAPWVSDNGKFYLYFETAYPTLGISSVTTEGAQSRISFDGSALHAAGEISVYNLAGAKLLRGNGTVDVTTLAPGIYIALTQASSLKFIVR